METLQATQSRKASKHNPCCDSTGNKPWYVKGEKKEQGQEMTRELVREFLLEKVENQTQQKQKETNLEKFQRAECLLLQGVWL